MNSLFETLQHLAAASSDPDRPLLPGILSDFILNAQHYWFPYSYSEMIAGPISRKDLFPRGEAAFKLPSPRVAIEDPASLIVLGDLDPQSGLTAKRIFVCFAEDNPERKRETVTPDAMDLTPRPQPGIRRYIFIAGVFWDLAYSHDFSNYTFRAQIRDARGVELRSTKDALFGRPVTLEKEPGLSRQCGREVVTAIEELQYVLLSI